MDTIIELSSISLLMIVVLMKSAIIISLQYDV